MTWQRYNKNLRKSPLLAEYFSFWTNLALFCPLLDKFDSILSSVIDSHLGLRSTLIGYQYSEIIRAIFSVFCCGGDCMSQEFPVQIHRCACQVDQDGKTV